MIGFDASQNASRTAKSKHLDLHALPTASLECFPLRKIPSLTSAEKLLLLQAAQWQSQDSRRTFSSRKNSTRCQKCLLSQNSVLALSHSQWHCDDLCRSSCCACSCSAYLRTQPVSLTATALSAPASHCFTKMQNGFQPELRSNSQVWLLRPSLGASKPCTGFWFGEA